MRAATQAHHAADIRVLVVDGPSGDLRVERGAQLASLLRPGDLVVVNDAATLPASLPARTANGEVVELRLTGERVRGPGRVCFGAALLGAGDHRTRTEDRPLPPAVEVGDRLTVGDALVAEVTALSSFSERLVELAFVGEVDAVWRGLYRSGKPVQYAHVPEPLALWDVQNLWAGRPWAVEMPSAGRVIRASTLAALRARGVSIATVTHAAGLSATGDPRIDARLPLPERFEVPEATATAVRETKARGGRVIAVGTSVVRALESAAQRAGDDGVLHGAQGITELLLGVTSALRVVDAIVTGVHEVDTSHFTLLGAFARAPVLEAALATAERAGLYGHELGDAWLVWKDPTLARSASDAGSVGIRPARGATVRPGRRPSSSSPPGTARS